MRFFPLVLFVVASSAIACVSPVEAPLDDDDALVAEDSLGLGTPAPPAGGDVHDPPDGIAAWHHADEPARLGDEAEDDEPDPQPWAIEPEGGEGEDDDLAWDVGVTGEPDPQPW